MGEKRVNQNCKAGAGVYFGAGCRAGERGVTDQERCDVQNSRSPCCRDGNCANADHGGCVRHL